MEMDTRVGSYAWLVRHEPVQQTVLREMTEETAYVAALDLAGWT